VNVWHVHGDGKPKHTTPGKIERRDGFSSNNRQLQFHQGNKRIALSLASGKVVSDVRPLEPAVISPDRRWRVSHEWEILSHLNRVRGVCRIGRKWVECWSRDFPETPAPTGSDFDGQREDFDRLGFVVNGTRSVVVFRRNRLLSMPFEEAARQLADGRPLEEEIVRVLDTETGQDVAEWRGGRSTLMGPNGELLHLRGPSLRILNLLKLGQPEITRDNSSGEHFTAAAFSPDGKLLATTSNDTTVTMWDTATWQPVQQYGWEIGRLRAVAFAPDGLTCAAGSDTGKVVLFDVD
jgi:WD40 repeat protein